MNKNKIISIIAIAIIICTFITTYKFKYEFTFATNTETKANVEEIEDNPNINDTQNKDETPIEDEPNINNNTDNKDNNVNHEDNNTSSNTNTNSKNIFKDYEELAQKKLQELSLDEKIAQTLLVHYTDKLVDDEKKYQFGGVIFFEKDFKTKTKDEIISMIKNLQNNAKIPMLTAIDEEGGKVSRLSSNKNVVDTPFKSSQELYKENGFDAIRDDTIRKSIVLDELGLNLNLAPVVDIASKNTDYIYNRTIGLNANLTGTFAKTVIETSKEFNVSYTLKHFPGYGNNADTHKGISIDTRSYKDIMNNDIIPFKMGIEANAEAIMVSHNIVTSIDKDYPASISKKIHDLLRNDLKFTGVIITDDLNMKALEEYGDVEINALKSGNNVLITADYQKSFNNIKQGINDNKISIEELDKIVTKVLEWKYYKQLL